MVGQDFVALIHILGQTVHHTHADFVKQWNLQTQLVGHVAVVGIQKRNQFPPGQTDSTVLRIRLSGVGLSDISDAGVGKKRSYHFGRIVGRPVIHDYGLEVREGLGLDTGQASSYICTIVVACYNYAHAGGTG